MRQVSIYGLLAVGMTFVILTAGIDLSIGSLLAFAGLVAAAVDKGGISNRFSIGAGQDALGYGWPLAALAAMAVGLAGGLLQGLAITRLKVPPFVVTLGGMSVFRGAALLFAGGGPISGFDPDFRLVGPGQDRTRAGAGDHLPRLRHFRPYRASLHALRPAGLRGRRQSGGGAPRRTQRPRGDQQRLRDHGLFRRPRRASSCPRASIRPKRSPAPVTNSPSSPRWSSAAPACSAASARSSAR